MSVRWSRPSWFHLLTVAGSCVTLFAACSSTPEPTVGGGADTTQVPPSTAAPDTTPAVAEPASTSAESTATAAPPATADATASPAATTASPPATAAASASASAAPTKAPGRTYRACGCGCCGGVAPTQTVCVYRSKGESLDAIIAKDKAAAARPSCRMAGCSIGTEYKECD